ncbi:MAG: N-acetyltransferase [Clostridia bacterium]|nr:N-acetyltransferase [Clostridia bacterium]
MSSGYKVIPLTALTEAKGEDWVREHLLQFSCPLNRDIENFLRYKAVVFSQQSLARTNLIYTSYRNETVLVGYFTIASKFFVIKRANVSRNVWDRLKKFGIFIPETKSLCISAPLIAQLGKNYTNDYNKLITGDEILGLALDSVHMAQNIIGGKIVYLECEDKPGLIEFYNRNNFHEFDRRVLEKDETEDLDGTHMIQMLRYD